MNQARKSQLEVTLSTGLTVAVGDISWPGYCALKDQFLELVTGRLLEDAGRLLSTPLAVAFCEGLIGRMPETGSLPSLVERSADAIRESLPKLVAQACDFLQLLDVQFVYACVKSDGFDVEQCTARDMILLREAAFQINDPAELIGLEKNFWAGLARSLKALIGTSLSSAPAGEPSGSIDSPALTVGPVGQSES